MSHYSLQTQYDKIYSYFRTTIEPFDLLEWDGKFLNVWDGDNIIESYKYEDLRALIAFL